MITTKSSWLEHNEVEALRKQYWPNVIRSGDKISIVKIFLNQFSSPLILILIGATAISFIMWENIEGLIICFVILINSIIGFYQEYSAEKGVEALKKIIPQKVKVKRGWIYRQIDTADLVPWDLIEIYSWDKIPADSVIISSNEFKVNESILSWESLPLSRDAWEVFMWTMVVGGMAKLQVLKTWMNTKFWEIAQLTSQTEPVKSPIQQEIEVIWKYVWIMVIIIVIFIFIYSITKSGFDKQAIIDALLYAVSIAVAAVPEGLATTMIILMAIGATNLIKKHALVRRLSAVATLWATTVICTDKTWTLTKNEMTVTHICTSTWFWSVWNTMIWNSDANSDKEVSQLITIWFLCNESNLELKDNTYSIIGDPTEGCLLILAKKFKLDEKSIWLKYRFIKTLSFDSQRKAMTSIYEWQWVTAFTKWAPDSILKMCSYIQENGTVRSINKEDIRVINEKIREYEANALRLLAFAYKDLKNDKLSIGTVESEMIYVWLVWIIDPPREEVYDAIKMAKDSWIKVVMITGDSPKTAEAIWINIWMLKPNSYNIITGDELSSLTDAQLKGELFGSKLPVFARVQPADKRRIVSLFQKHGEKVAVTWDWVNDAPALKKADIWIAMWIAWTDTAKESSDMILLDDSFWSIISAIEEGRRIFENMRKFIYYVFSTNIWELVLIIWAILLGYKAPLTAALILSVNLLTDIFPALALWLEPASKDLFLKSPHDYSKRIFCYKFVIQILIFWSIMWLLCLQVYRIYYVNYWYPYAISTVFVLLVLLQVANSFNSKSRRLSLLSTKLSTNYYLYWSAFLALMIVYFVVQTSIWNIIFKTVPLSINTWLSMFWLSLIIILLDEARKAFSRH